MVKIGNKEVVFSSLLLIPEDEKAELELNYSENKLKIIISFDDSGDQQLIQPIPFEDASGVELVFKNWNKGLGSVLKEHVRLADHANGGVLKFIAANNRIGNLNIMNIQFVVEKVEK